MKKILLGTMMAVAAISANAQTNLVTNGDFEGNYTMTQQDGVDILETLTGWDLGGINVWNCRVNIEENEEDGDLIDANNKQCLHLQRYKWNGWFTATVSQTISGLEANQTYTLSAIVARKLDAVISWDAHAHGFKILNVKEDGTAGDVIKTDANVGSSSDWQNYSLDFTATSDKVMVQIFMDPSWAGANKDQGEDWLDVDNISLVKKSSTAVKDITTTNNEPIEYFDMQGKSVLDSQTGLVIVKQGKSVKKVIR